MTDKKNILFVDDEPGVLQGLRRSLRSQRNAWDMTFVESGEAALAAAKDIRFDAVVSDMRMPGMSGAEVIKTFSERSPDTIRIILSGHSEEQLIAQVAGVAHQFMSKPSDPHALKEVLQRAFDLGDLIGDARLHQFVGGLTQLPSLPRVYQAVVEKLQSPETSLHDIGQIIGSDPAMTVKLLQLVNSAFFGVGQRVTDCTQATALIGLDVLKTLVLSIGVFSPFESMRVRDEAFSVEESIRESYAVGGLAREIARAADAGQEVVADSLLAGVLHDIGLLILEQDFSEDYVSVRRLLAEKDLSLIAAEEEVFGTNHAAIGAYLLGLWGLPRNVVEAVAFHHSPSESSCESFSPLAAVHVACALYAQRGLPEGEAFPSVDRVFLERLGMLDNLHTWMQLRDAMGERDD